MAFSNRCFLSKLVPLVLEQGEQAANMGSLVALAWIMGKMAGSHGSSIFFLSKLRVPEFHMNHLIWNRLQDWNKNNLFGFCFLGYDPTSLRAQRVKVYP